MNNRKEYRGEKIIEGLTARMMPSNSGYPDCMCELFLTNQHLYVVEDNFDGTYENHFVFTLGVIKEIGMAKVEEDESLSYSEAQVSTKNFLIGSALGLLAGFVLIPGRGMKVGGDTFFAITYLNEGGGIDKLFFKELQGSAKPIVKAFRKVRTAFYSE